MVYKLQSIAERVKRLQMSYSDLYNLIVAELTQAIVNKIVDLALVEGDGTNGFKSIEKEADAKKIKKLLQKPNQLAKLHLLTLLKKRLTLFALLLDVAI